MGRRKSDGNKVLGFLLIGLGAVCLYYLKAGTGQGNNAALLPDSLEDRIDRLVDTLNAKVGKNWGNWGAAFLKSYLQNVLPPTVVALVDVVYAVEQEGKRTRMTGQAKRQLAAALIVRGSAL